MKNIATVLSGNALDQAINFLLQEHFNILKVELNDRLSQSLNNQSIDLLIIDLSAMSKVRRISLTRIFCADTKIQRIT